MTNEATSYIRPDTRSQDAPSHFQALRFRTTMNIPPESPPSVPSDTTPSSPGSDYIPPEEPLFKRPPHGWHPSQAPRNVLPQTSKRSRYVIYGVVAVSVMVIAVTLIALRDRIRIANLRRKGIPPGLWSNNGALYAGEQPFAIKGLSWFGMEEEHKVFGGMDHIPLTDVFNFIKKHNFNAIRVPLSIDNILEDGFPSDSISTFKNSQLLDISYLRILRYIIRKAADENVLILLDVHRLKNTESPNRSNGLWHSPSVSEDKLFEAWKILCGKFGDEWNIMGADLFNEPYEATWGSNKPLEDWKMASEKLTASIQEACPSWLILIQGVANREKTKEPTFWAENLNAMYDKPPKAELSKKVALSPHVYGPGTNEQPYFQNDDFVEKMPPIWEDHFGLASKKTGFATIVGEWGGRFTEKDREWQQGFLKYLIDKKMSSFYWCLNPESHDTGGLLKEGWSPPETEKLKLLEKLPSSSVEESAIHFKHLRNWRTQ